MRPRQKPRMDYGAIVHQERYQQDGHAESLDRYDATLAEHYGAIGTKTTPDSWTRDIAAKFHPPRREKLRQTLKEMGFDFR